MSFGHHCQKNDIYISCVVLTSSREISSFCQQEKLFSCNKKYWYCQDKRVLSRETVLFYCAEIVKRKELFCFIKRDFSLFIRNSDVIQKFLSRENHILCCGDIVKKKELFWVIKRDCFLVRRSDVVKRFLLRENFSCVFLTPSRKMN